MDIDITFDNAAPMKGVEEPQRGPEQKKGAEDNDVSGVNW